jgi:probable F420-dependent oxidoreductase
MPHPFRFTTSMPALTAPVAKWRDEIRRIEDLGFSSVAISDHLTGGWSMDPVVTMTVAAEATSRLRVLAMVFCNDLRHPALLHRSMANLDVVSDGRVEIGLGAGWKQEDYRATGIAFDPPAARVSRLAESVDVINGLFASEVLTYTGAHYRVHELAGLPRPVQRPRPPLLIGGGGRRVLELAGRSADIVGVNPRLTAGADRGAVIEQMTPGALGQKVTWARDAAALAGRRPPTLEFQQSVLDVSLTHRGIRHRWTSSLAVNASADVLARSPAALHGDLSRCVDTLVQRREEYGVSYLHLGGNLEAAALIVGRLTGC